MKHIFLLSLLSYSFSYASVVVDTFTLGSALSKKIEEDGSTVCVVKFLNDSILDPPEETVKRFGHIPTSDFGHTHSLSFHCFELKDGVRSGFSYKTDLFTKATYDSAITYVKGWGYRHLFSGQNFYEVNTLKFIKENILKGLKEDKVYFIFEAGVGQYHNTKGNILGAAEQQQAFHDLIGVPQDENLYGDTDVVKPLLRLGAGKHYKLSDLADRCNCEVDRLRVEAGLDVLTLAHGSQVYALFAVDKNLVFKENFLLGLFFDIEARYNSNYGLRTTRHSGVYYQNNENNFRVEVGIIYNDGDRNNPMALRDYDDDEPVLDISFVWAF